MQKSFLFTVPIKTQLSLLIIQLTVARLPRGSLMRLGSANCVINSSTVFSSVTCCDTVPLWVSNITHLNQFIYARTLQSGKINQDFLHNSWRGLVSMRIITTIRNKSASTFAKYISLCRGMLGINQFGNCLWSQWLRVCVIFSSLIAKCQIY